MVKSSNPQMNTCTICLLCVNSASKTALVAQLGMVEHLPTCTIHLDSTYIGQLFENDCPGIYCAVWLCCFAFLKCLSLVIILLLSALAQGSEWNIYCMYVCTCVYVSVTLQKCYPKQFSTCIMCMCSPSTCILQPDTVHMHHMMHPFTWFCSSVLSNIPPLIESVM